MSDNEPEKGKKKFKMPNTYVILFGVICFIAVLSWFVPGGAYELNANGDAISGTYHIVESNPQGLWDVFMAPITGMLGSGAISGAIAISLTILLFGSFLEMMEETGAVKTALKRITMKNQNNMHLLIAILVCLMSFLGTLEGAYEEGIVYFLMFVPVILALGLDTVVAIMIVVLGTQAGCLASTVNPFATGIASGIAGISAGDGMGMRVLMLVVFTGLVIFIINRYADKVRLIPRSRSSSSVASSILSSSRFRLTRTWSCPAVRRACWPSSSSRSPSWWWGACRGLPSTLIGRSSSSSCRGSASRRCCARCWAATSRRSVRGTSPRSPCS